MCINTPFTSVEPSIFSPVLSSKPPHHTTQQFQLRIRLGRISSFDSRNHSPSPSPTIEITSIPATPSPRHTELIDQRERIPSNQPGLMMLRKSPTAEQGRRSLQIVSWHCSPSNFREIGPRSRVHSRSVGSSSSLCQLHLVNLLVLLSDILLHQDEKSDVVEVVLSSVDSLHSVDQFSLGH